MKATLGSVALLLALTLPFLGRAHHIDDPFYIGIAQRIVATPLDPLGGQSFWHEKPTTAFFDSYNPPLTGYLLALPLALGLDDEHSVHAVMVLVAALALLAAASAGRRLGVEPRWTLLLASSPALAVSAVSAMADVPFLLLSVLCWRAALTGRAGRAGAWAGLGALTKYVGFLNLPLCMVAQPRPRLRRTLRTAVVFAALFGAWCLWSWRLYGQAHVLAASRFQQIHRQGTFLLSFVASVGLAGLPAALPLLRWRAENTAAFTLAGLTGALFAWARTASIVTGLLGLLAFGSGAALLVSVVRASARARWSSFEAMSFWLYACYTVLLVYFGSARYLLPLLPPLLWLLVRGGELESQARRGRWIAAVSGAAVVCTALLWGDYGYAGAWRRAAAELPAAPRAFQTGRWGFAWYAGQHGYAPLPPRERLRAGDVVAEPRGIHAPPPSPAQSALLVSLSTVTVPSPALRLMDGRAWAGFYSSTWGVLPCGFRADARETVALFSPASWLLTLADQTPGTAVALDLGTAEARHVLLDGWAYAAPAPRASGPDVQRTIVWVQGSESALRLPLPRAVRVLSLRAFAVAEATGPLRIQIGPGAAATVRLEAGWRSYRVPIIGDVAGGLTDVVLQPASQRRPAWVSADTRSRTVTLDALVFGDAPKGPNRGFWPVALEAGEPALLVSSSEVRLIFSERDGVRGRADVRVLSGRAEWLRVAPGRPPESVALPESCSERAGCAVDLESPPGGACLLRADHALVRGLMTSNSNQISLPRTIALR